MIDIQSLEEFSELITIPDLVDPEVRSWLDHIPFAYYLVKTTKPEIIVELGVHSGNSLNAFCHAVKSLDLPTKCFGIDHWKGDGQAGYYDENIYHKLQKQHKQIGYYKFTTLIRKYFHEAVSHFEDHSIDILHIDGFHTYEAVKNDFEVFKDKVKPQGIVLFHDVAVRDNDFGVYEFWEELQAQYLTKTFQHGNGLGILFLGDKDSPQYKSLFSDPNIEEIFFNLGRVMSNALPIPPEKGEAIDDTAQLYLDLGDGFNANNVINKNINKGRNYLEFDLSTFSNVLSLRFDPASKACRIQIKEVLIEQGQYTITSNPTLRNMIQVGSSYTAITEDPQIIIEDFQKPGMLSKVVIDFYIEAYDVDPTVEIQQQFIHTQQEAKKAEIEILGQHINHLEALIDQSKLDLVDQYNTIGEKIHQGTIQRLTLSQKIEQLTASHDQQFTRISERDQLFLARFSKLEEKLQTLIEQSKEEQKHTHSGIAKLGDQLQELEKALQENDIRDFVSQQSQDLEKAVLSLQDAQEKENQRLQVSIEELTGYLNDLQKIVSNIEIKVDDTTASAELRGGIDQLQQEVNRVFSNVEEQHIQRANEGHALRQKVEQTEQKLDHLGHRLIQISEQIQSSQEDFLRTQALLQAEESVPSKGSLFQQMFSVGRSNPRRFFSQLSIKNVRTLFRALGSEPPSLILENFKKKLNLTGANTAVPELAPPTEVSMTITTEDTVGEPLIEDENDTPITIHLDIVEKFNEKVTVNGWVVFKYSSLKKLDVFINQELAFSGKPTLATREDVQSSFPTYQHALNSGINLAFNYSNTIQEGFILIEDESGRKGQINFDKNKIKEFNLSNQKRKPYSLYVERNILSEQDRSNYQEYIQQWEIKPLISILIPVYKVDVHWIDLAVKSIEHQLYTNWELILVDDCSNVDELNNYLNDVNQSDQIHVLFNEQNRNISYSTNRALEIAQGEFVLFMDHDDMLNEIALFEIVKCLQVDSSIDLLYSDEDKIDTDGNHFDPYFKPDWSPELLLSYNYINHLVCIRASIARAVNGLRSKYDGVQDWDFLLRATQKAQNIKHIPKVLYHWRALETSIAGGGAAKAASHKFFQKCIDVSQEMLDQRGLEGTAIHPDFAQKGNLGLIHIKWPDEGPDVSIVIPTKDHYETIKECIDSLNKTTYQNFNIIIADNDSTDPKTLSYYKSLKKQDHIQVITVPNPGNRFNYSYINNKAIQSSTSAYVLLLNDDISVISPTWLSDMMGYVQLKGVGAVGAKLLYPDNTIQHAGVLNNLFPHGYANLPDHALKGLSANQPSFGFYSHVSRNYSAVTAACLLVKKDLFQQINGLDEQSFPLAYNDIDLCLRILQEGYRVVYCATATLYHYESKSRGNKLYIEEVANFKRKWRQFKDPYYNPNFSKITPFQVVPKRVSNAYRKRKILAFTHNLNLEGAPIQLLDIIIGLQKTEDFEFKIVTPKMGPLSNRYLEAGIEIEVCSFIEPDNLIASTDQFEALVHWISDEKPHTILANTLSTYYAIAAGHELSIETFWIIHESVKPTEYYHIFPNLPKRLGLKAITSVDMAVFVAKSTAQLFIPFLKSNNYSIINNGIQKDQFPTISRGEARKRLNLRKKAITFLNLGTVCKRKGQLDYTIAAIEFLLDLPASERYKFQFILVGARRRGSTGVYLDTIEQKISEANLQKNFNIVDETKDVFPYYAAADIFVCSSYNESYPRVILEAMHYSLPVITTPIFGITEQVLEQINALFYPAGNIKELRDRIQELALDQVKRKKLSKNSKEVFELITSYDEMIVDYYNLINGEYGN